MSFRTPYGARAIATRSGASPATLSRVIDLLERDALLVKDSRGRVTDLDWAGTVRRWSQDYELRAANATATYLDPRGLTTFIGKLAESRALRRDRCPRGATVRSDRARAGGDDLRRRHDGLGRSLPTPTAEYTTDADLAVSPDDLSGEPLLADLLADRGFIPREHPGGWLSSDGVYIDVMVAEALAGPGRRGARLGPHGSRSPGRAKGLEAALVDRDRHTIRALDPRDARTETIFVAGPAALLVAKSHKIAERVGAQDRARDKDALDVLRLRRAVETDDFAERLARCRIPTSQPRSRARHAPTSRCCSRTATPRCRDGCSSRGR